MRLSKGKRVQSSNDAAPKVGNIIDGAGPKQWKVKWDGIAEPETRARSSIKLVGATTALSPTTAAVVRGDDPADGGEDEEQVDDSASDKDSSSEDDAEKLEELNPHTRKRNLWRAFHAKEIGKTTTVSFFFFFNTDTYIYIYLPP